jgi:dephospho-CoA kinase
MRRQAPKKRIILGVTGSLGSGKTTVAKMLGCGGAKIIDADRIAHRVIRAGTKIYRKIVGTFGNDILEHNKSIDRDKLAKMVFSNKNILKLLNRITHPEIIRIIKREIERAPEKVIVLDAPLLIEAGLEKIVDKLIVVKIRKRQQLKRIQEKTSINKTEILKRIKYQFPLSHKVRLADFVIDNSGTMKKTKKQVEQIRRLLWKN